MEDFLVEGLQVLLGMNTHVSKYIKKLLEGLLF
jgi:hypothetical protein